MAVRHVDVANATRKFASYGKKTMSPLGRATANRHKLRWHPKAPTGLVLTALHAYHIVILVERAVFNQDL